MTLYRQLYRQTLPDSRGRWTGVEENGKLRRFHKHERSDFSQVPAGSRLFGTVSQWAPSFSATNVYDFDFEGTTLNRLLGSCWVTFRDKMSVLGQIDRLFVEGDSQDMLCFTMIFHLQRSLTRGTTLPRLKKKLMLFRQIDSYRALPPDDHRPRRLVLDPTCGSGTTAYVAEQWGRRWITCDTSRVALALARTRLMAAKYPYYLLADSPEGIKKETELTGKMPPEYKTEGDIRKGFVYKRVPHVTLKSIANNPDIKEGMTRQQIDAAIARHADTETLYDQPYEDNKRVRVCGPFSVESLSPHRVL